MGAIFAGANVMELQGMINTQQLKDFYKHFSWLLIILMMISKDVGPMRGSWSEVTGRGEGVGGRSSFPRYKLYEHFATNTCVFRHGKCNFEKKTLSQTFINYCSHELNRPRGDQTVSVAVRNGNLGIPSNPYLSILILNGLSATLGEKWRRGIPSDICLKM